MRLMGFHHGDYGFGICIFILPEMACLSFGFEGFSSFLFFLLLGVLV